MARLREVCGAVSAMFMIVGLKYGYADPKDDFAKAEHYKRIQELARKFRAEHGTIICRELLNLSCEWDEYTPEKRTKEYYQRRPCTVIVGSAARITAELIEEMSDK